MTQIEKEGSLEPDSAKSDIKKAFGYLLLATALVIFPSQLTSKRVEVKSPNIEISLGQLEPTANATSFQDLLVDPEVVPETAPEPAQAVVEPEVIPTPPPVEKPVTEPPVQPEAPAIVGNKLDWLTASNIPRKDWELADWLIKRESSWNPNAQNPRSTAYGLKQFLDGTWAGVGCEKALAINNPVYQLNCGQKYVMARYGSWEAANAFWRVHKWY